MRAAAWLATTSVDLRIEPSRQFLLEHLVWLMRSQPSPCAVPHAMVLLTNSRPLL